MERVNGNLLKDFIMKVKDSFNREFEIGYEIDKEDSPVRIWHTYRNYNEQEFKNIIGKYIRECLFENGIYNFYISYESGREIPFYNIPSNKFNFEANTVKWVEQLQSLDYEYIINTCLKTSFNNEEIFREAETYCPKVYIEKELLASIIYKREDSAA